MFSVTSTPSRVRAGSSLSALYRASRSACGLVPERAVQGVAFGLGRGVLAQDLDLVVGRAHRDPTLGPVDDGQLALAEPAQRLLDLTDHRDLEGAGDDHEMHGRRALLDHHRAQAPAVVLEQLGRAEVAGHEHDVLGQRLGRQRLELAGEMA
jgi:hypothetical protein